MKRSPTLVAAVLLIGAATLLPSGCGGSDDPGDDQGIACTTDFRYGLTVRLRDATTGAPIPGADLVLTEGAYVEVLMAFPAGDYVGAGERAGTYVLTVSAPGYHGTVRDPVVITADVCHVIPVALDIALAPI